MRSRYIASVLSCGGVTIAKSACLQESCAKSTCCESPTRRITGTHPKYVHLLQLRVSPLPQAWCQLWPFRCKACAVILLTLDLLTLDLGYRNLARSANISCCCRQRSLLGLKRAVKFVSFAANSSL